MGHKTIRRKWQKLFLIFALQGLKYAYFVGYIPHACGVNSEGSAFKKIISEYSPRMWG